MTGVEAHFPAATRISVLISTCNRFLEETVSIRKVGYPAFGSVPISGAVAAETTTQLVSLGEHMLRGIKAPCAVFTLPDA
jgi:hypothetical protein